MSAGKSYDGRQTLVNKTAMLARFDQFSDSHSVAGRRGVTRLSLTTRRLSSTVP